MHLPQSKNICTTIGVYSSPVSWQTGSEDGSKKAAVNLGERRDFFSFFFSFYFFPTDKRKKIRTFMEN